MILVVFGLQSTLEVRVPLGALPVTFVAFSNVLLVAIRLLD